MTQVSSDRVRQALGDVQFPVSKDQLVRHAERAGTDEDVVRTLRSLPLGDYASAQEVVRSVGTVDATGQSRSHGAAAAREHDHRGIAQHMKRTRD